GQDRDLLIADETDPAREERDEARAVAAEAGAEREDVGPVQEERPLLGEEQRESREVRLARVYLGLGEVGVDGERGEGVRAEPLRDVQARVERAVRRSRGRVVLEAADERGPDAEAQAQVEHGQAGEETGAARLEDAEVLARARPPVGLLEPLDSALDVEAP